jgi:class 3 adenylate cyclase
LGAFSRVLLFDRRGVGLSDPVFADTPPTLEQWMDDAIAVMDDVGCDQVAILGADVHGSQVTMFLSATHPTRVSATVIVNGSACLFPEDGIPATQPAPTPAPDANVAEWMASEETFRSFAPSLAGDPTYREWWRRSMLRSSSPGNIRVLMKTRNETDARPILPTIAVPTLVLHRKGNVAYGLEHGRYIAAHIPTARFVELVGTDQFIFAGDQDELLEEIEEFLTGVRPMPEPDRVLATVLFTDIVNSTETAADLGDRRWHEVLDQHDLFVNRQLDRFGGRRVHSIGQGDGVLAIFEGPARAIRCARASIEAVRVLGIEIRCGLHTGEVERRAEDIGGIAVHLAARVKEQAGGNEVLVSRTVTDLVAGSGLQFDDRGEHEMKGVPGRWQLFAVKA